MNTRKRAYGCIVLAILFMSVSCATTHLMSVWKSESYKGPVKKVAVIGVSRRPHIRTLFENEWVKDLKARGTDAVASDEILTMKELGNPQVVLAKIKELGADAVLVTRLIDRSSLPNYIPGRMDQMPNYESGWSDYYGDAFATQSSATGGEYAYLETNVYDIRTEQIVWSGRSDTWLSEDDQKTITSFIGVIVSRLQADKIVQ